MDARDLFVSYSSDDGDVARDLRPVLEAGGYSCWMAPDDISGTGTWAEQILDAIESCRALLVLVSGNANASPHVSREVNLALARKRPILPIRIEDVAPGGALEYLLSLVQRVDAFPPPIQQHGTLILKRLASVLRSSDTEPVATEATQTKPATKPRGATRPRAAARRAPAAIGPGTVIDDFTLETLVGEGGMGTVYRARQSEPNRAVALKVLRPDHAADEAYRRRFLSEKDTLASLEHPGIVPIYAAGEDEGVLYIAMRLIDGSDLGARIEAQGRLSLRETVEILRPIADAIDYAHAAGVIHRDIKPANIILDRQGRAYLTDFGLGKRLDAPSQLTEQGVTVGTLGYMAPEQFSGELDPATANRIDIYALGCVAYMCLAGKPPFVRSTPTELMHAHTSEPPPSILSIRPELPQAVDDVLQTALEKDPARRYPAAIAFVSALETAFMSPAMGQTVTFKKASADPGTRVSTWLRANMSTAVILGSLAAIALVVTIAVAGGFGKDPGESGEPSAGPTGVASGDVQPPVGGAVSIVSTEPGLEATVTTGLNVTVNVDSPTDASGVSTYVAANGPIRPQLSEAQAYSDSFSWRLAEGAGVAGPRTVYVWFGDRLGNWTDTPVQATIAFDNAPVLHSVTWTLRRCNDDYTLALLTDRNPVASDPDGSLSLVRFWTGAADFDADEATDLSRLILPDRQSVEVSITGATQNLTLTDYFTVKDEAGVSRDGSVSLAIEGC